MSVGLSHGRERVADPPRDLDLEVTVLMPCLDEAETIATCVDKAYRALNGMGVFGEVLVADNGSNDGSQAIAREHGARVIDVPARGYGSALMAGIEAARGRYVIMGDADDSYDFEAIAPFVEQLRDGYDLVVGNRFRGGIAPGAMPWLHRRLGNPFLSRLGRFLFGSPVGDFYCGLRGFRRDAARALRLRSTGMEFAHEMIVKASLRGCRVTEVPTTLSPDGRSRAPHLNTFRDGWRTVRFLLLYRPRWLLFYPGVALMLLGLLTMLLVLPGPRSVAGVSFDVHTMLFGGTAVVLGYQAVVFATFGRIYAMTEGFLPDDDRLRRLFRFLNLEVGLLAGALLLVAGLAISVWALVIWSDRSFGALDYAQTLRIVIPASVLLTLGSQTILSSVFLSFLGLRDPQPARPA